MVTWDTTQTANKTFKFSKASRRECALCLNSIYWGKKRGNRKHKNAQHGHYINDQTRYELYHKYEVIFGPNQGLCTDCNNLNDIDKELLEQAVELETISTHKFMNKLIDVTDKYATNKSNIRKDKTLLSPDKLEGDKFKTVCGLERENMEHIVTRLKEDDVLINFLHLFIACTVWYNNLCYRFAAALFGYEYESGIQYAIDTIINKLTFSWVPKHIGSTYWTPEKIMVHNPQFVNKLYPDKQILGCLDATYLYKQHAERNFQYQKETYSMHKHRNLQKEHVWCTTDGYVVQCDGPYAADRSDSHIWNSIIHDADHQFYDIIGDWDDEKCPYSICADRGYKEVVNSTEWPELLLTKGVKTAPKVKHGDPKQLSQEQADSSRFVF